MDDSSLWQRFRINAMHGHDIGVWVCEGSGLSISPCLFMQSICPDPPPRSLFVKWKQTVLPPMSFRRAGHLPLVYSDSGRIPPWPYYLHLFAPQVPIARSFEQESGLQDWSLAVPAIGIIVIFDKKYDGPPATLSLNRLISRFKSSKPKTNRSLAWVQRQQLPFVIAALGYDDTSAAKQQLRSRYGIAADIPIMPGPALTDVRQQDVKREGAQTTSMFSSVLGPQKLAFDGQHARAVLSALYQLVERRR